MNILGAKQHTVLCSNAPCMRRATHVALAGNLLAPVCAICAGEALKATPGTRLKPMAAYRP